MRGVKVTYKKAGKGHWFRRESPLPDLWVEGFVAVHLEGLFVVYPHVKDTPKDEAINRTIDAAIAELEAQRPSR